MLKDFKQHALPIDGVGLQMHISRLDYDTDAVAKNIARLTKLGLQVHITELDVSLPVDSQGEAKVEDLVRQAEIYRGVVRAWVTNPGCTAIQTWGLTAGLTRTARAGLRFRLTAAINRNSLTKPW